MADRDSYKAVARPLRIGFGLTRPVVICAVSGGITVNMLSRITAEPWLAMVYGLVTMVLIWAGCRFMLALDPKYFTIVLRAFRLRALYDAGRREPVEVWIV